MDRLPTPRQTPIARQWLAQPQLRLGPLECVLLGTVDGRRNLVQLESIARALRLAPDALEVLHSQGLIDITTAP